MSPIAPTSRRAAWAHSDRTPSMGRSCSITRCPPTSSTTRRRCSPALHPACPSTATDRGSGADATNDGADDVADGGRHAREHPDDVGEARKRRATCGLYQELLRRPTQARVHEGASVTTRCSHRNAASYGGRALTRGGLTCA